VERLKSLTTTRYINGVKHNGWQPFPGRLWQRNYHDRIIRHETELNRVRTYICNNPANWESDEINLDVNIKDRTVVQRDASFVGAPDHPRSISGNHYGKH